MNGALKATLVGGACLLVGVGIGAAGGEESSAVPTTTTKTVTEPAPPAETVTETETVTEVPTACLDALDGADALLGDSADFAKIIVRYPKLVYDAATAGAAFDRAGIRDVTARIRAISADVRDVNDSVVDHGVDYQTGRDECREAE